jgi:GcrA cell cycle regulator
MSIRPSWTDERVTALADLWREGLSAAEIARRLGGVTRNAVIGKVHRLGLSGRAPPSRPSTPRRAPARTGRRAVSVPLRRLVPPPTPLAPPPSLPGTATVVSVCRHACRWPIGDPLASDFMLCGRPVARGAYCASHAEVAYRPAAERPCRDHLLKLAGLA